MRREFPPHLGLLSATNYRRSGQVGPRHFGSRKMKRNNFEQHVLPRPVDRLPDYPQAKARVALAERLIESFNLDSEAAMAISNSVVDPSSLRKSIGDPIAP